MKQNILLFFSLLMSCALYADQLTPSQALSRALSNSSSCRAKSIAKSTLTLAYTSTVKDNNTYYVFNEDNSAGFLIVSADDCMPAILAEGDNGSFNYDEAPEQLKDWLGQYDYAANSMIVSEAKTTTITPVTNFDYIEPFFKNKNGEDITWWQNSPINSLTPTLNGSHMWTGCASTCMSQIMYFYQWPERGNGSHSYFCSSLNQTLSSVFSEHTYQYDKMKCSYLTTDTDDDNAASQITFDTGVAVEMSYNPTSGSASSTTNTESMVPNAFRTYFGYKSTVEYVNRENDYGGKSYSDTEWEQLVWDELNAGRPLMYTGHRESGSGHVWICDGYKDGRFHMCWGFNQETGTTAAGGKGGYNGYYLVTCSQNTDSILNPRGTAYAYTQGVVRYIEPDKSDTPTSINGVFTPETENVPTYNILGQRVDENTKGVIIRGKKKYVNR